MGSDSSAGIATRYGLDRLGIESRWGARFSALVKTGAGAYPASCTMGTGSFPGVKRPRRGADHPPPSKCRGYGRVGLYLYWPSGPQWPVIRWTFTFTFRSFYYHYFLLSPKLPGVLVFSVTIFISIVVQFTYFTTGYHFYLGLLKLPILLWLPLLSLLSRSPMFISCYG